MSLILDALSRAEREKREQADSAPTILSQELAVPEPPKDARVWVLLAAVGIVVVAGASFLYWSPDHRPAPPAPVVVEPSPELRGENLDARAIVYDAPVAPEDSRRSPERVEAVAESVSLPDAESRAQLNRALEQTSRAVAALYAVPAEESADNTLEESAAAGSAVAAPEDGPAIEQPVDEDVIDVEQVLREVRARATRNTLEPHPAPLLEDLSKQFRDRVPTLMYSRHDYNTAGRPSVIINGETLSPSQRIRGVEVREILSDSVILRFEGTDFRLRSLNSWVNL